MPVTFWTRILRLNLWFLTAGCSERPWCFRFYHISINGLAMGSMSAFPPGPKFIKRGVQNSTPQNWGAKAPGKKRNFELVALFAAAILSQACQPNLNLCADIT